MSNTDIKVKKARCADQRNVGVSPRCVCCGKEYKSPKISFPESGSPLFAGNGGRLPICRTCMRKHFTRLSKRLLGDKKAALKLICAAADIYFDLETAARLENEGGLDPTSYIKALYENEKFRSMSFLDSSGEDGENADISPEIRKKWGLNWKDEEYALLEEHYAMLRGQSQNPAGQELQIRQLCEIYILKYRARCKGDVGEYEKTAKLYNSLYSAGEFKTGINRDDSFSKPLGVMNMIVEGICPSEYYKDENLHRDYDGYEDYWRRFIIRPFSNLINNRRDMDAEFSVKDGDEN